MKPTNRFLSVVSVLLFAGCVAEDPSNPAASSSNADSSNAFSPPSDDEGAIIVTVVTGEVEPVAAAQVTLEGTNESAFTDEAGVARFDALVPNTYTALAAKPGYRALESSGKLVTVNAGETVEAKLTLDPVPVINATNAYHKTIPFEGFLSCAFEAQPGTGVGYTTYCGRGLTPNGVNVGDPNDKSLFKFQIESPAIRGVILEGEWTTSSPASSPQMRMRVTSGLQCSSYSCMTNNAEIDVGGRSPLLGVKIEGDKSNLTKRWGIDAAKYPVDAWAEARAYCATDCTGAGINLQQPFEMYVTLFYGREPDPAFSHIKNPTG